jgi:hypothetical protein
LSFTHEKSRDFKNCLIAFNAVQELGSATEGGADAALREDFEKQLAENKAIIDDLRSVRREQ